MADKKLLILYHSQSGNTEKMAHAVLEGAQREEDCDSRLVKAVDAKIEDLLNVDGVIFGTPENFGYMSGALKDFFDRTYYDALPHQLNLPYALFVSAGNDGTGAVREVDRILRGYPLKKVAEALIGRGEVTAEHLQACREMGHGLASGLSLGIY